MPPFSILQLINRDGFCILNAYLLSEATRLKMSITFVVGVMETLAPSVALKTCTCLWGWARETINGVKHLLADDIVDVQTMRRKHFAI